MGVHVPQKKRRTPTLPPEDPNDKRRYVTRESQYDPGVFLVYDRLAKTYLAQGTYRVIAAMVAHLNVAERACGPAPVVRRNVLPEVGSA